MRSDRVGPLTRDQAMHAYASLVGRPPMEDPPAAWANMASWMADDARSVTAFRAWFRSIPEPPARFVQRPHVPPTGRRRLVIDRVPRDLEAVYAQRRLGLVHSMRRLHGELADIDRKLATYETLLRAVGLVDESPRGRPPEWGVDTFAFVFPFLWARHGARPRLTMEVVALAARALSIDSEDLETPVAYWARRCRRVKQIDPTGPRPEAALFRMIRREHGDDWERELAALLAQGIHRHDPEGQHAERGGSGA